MRSGSVWYEQWPEHVVDALSAEEAATIPRDGQWHRVAPVYFHLTVREVRFTRAGIAQAISSDRESEIFQGMRNVSPPPTSDDSSWEISSTIGEFGTCYIVTSDFSVTHGPFDWQSRFDTILEPYGLGVEPQKYFLRGEAYFTDLESGCFADAIQRLAWLETFFVQTNLRVEDACSASWKWLEGQLNERASVDATDSGELIAPPTILEPLGPKSEFHLSPGARPNVPRITEE